MKRKQSNNISRRDAIKLGIIGVAGISFLKPVTLFGKTAPITGKAKSVIQIWMWGGPAHLDTFDPKPDAGYDYCGPYDKPIATNIDGIRIGQKLTQLAKHADKYSIIRSMTHGINAHETASYITQTGHRPGRIVYPSAGAVISKFKGYDNGYKGAVPPYIVMTKLQGRFSEAGFLGMKYKPFATGGDPNRTPFAVEGIISPSINDKRQRSRRELLGDLDTLGKAMDGNTTFEEFSKAEESAYDMMFGGARNIFDLSKEKEAVRDMYGRNTFGQSCLMARRLVEHGVPYITINYRGGDTHKQHFQIMDRKLPEMDQGMAALLSDLSQRGLLDSTIVWWGGEFGRSPKIQWDAPWNGGRSHHGECFSSVVAGGGFKGGRVVGASDTYGMNVAERPVHPRDMIGSIYELMGIDPDAKLPNERNIDTKIMPPSEKGGRLKEIM